jgi:FkbM family methyltransferase
MVRPAVVDPPELESRLWDGFSGAYGWDVGANCGQTIPIMCTRFDRFTSFEPCADSFEYVHQLFGFADIRQLAVSDHDGELDLAFPAREQRETGQLVTIGTKGMEWEPEDWDAVEKVTVPCRTADSLAAELGVPDFVKVDTEGHELSVLHGATALLNARETSWLIEFHSPGNQLECGSLLAVSGHYVQVIRHPYYPEDSHMWHQHGWLRAIPKK